MAVVITDNRSFRHRLRAETAAEARHRQAAKVGAADKAELVQRMKAASKRGAFEGNAPDFLTSGPLKIVMRGEA